MGKGQFHDRIGVVIKNATAQGAVRKSATLWEWDVSAGCSQPRQVELWGRPSATDGRRYIGVKRGTAHLLQLVLATPCRRCKNCVDRKARMWIARAMHEIREANRTWFATFTLSPRNHYVMQSRALLAKSARSIPISELSPDDVITAQSNEIGKELTKFLKRVRKQAGSRSLRYLLVREDHKSGLPHFHALIHECGDLPIKHKVLSENWTWGFSKFKLIEEGERAAYYSTKYLNKVDRGRVRASLNYGRIAGVRHTASAIANVVQRDEMDSAALAPLVQTKKSQKESSEISAIEIE